MWLSDISVKRPVFITMVMLALVVMGAIAYTRLGVDLYPDVSFPVAAVQTVYPGANPEEVESQVSKPLEEAVSSLSGVRAVRSTSSEGLSLVIVEYNLEYPIAKGVEEVRERVYANRGSLPQDIYDPIIMRFDPAMMPVLSFAVTDKGGKLGSLALRKLAEDKIAPRLERIEGVAAAQVEGGLEREIQVELSADRLRALGIAPQQVVAAIKGENLSIPGGRLEEGSRDLLLRTPGNFQRWEEIGQVVVANRGGTPIYVRDVAEVRDGTKEVRYHTRLDGTDSVMVLVRKQSGTNTVQVVERAHEEIERILRESPNLSIAIAFDQSDFIKASTQDTIVDLILGGVLAALVVFIFFLDPRGTFITVIGLPVIVVAAFWGISLFGFTLNMITLLALALCIGLLIDDAIVVRENIFRHIEGGENAKVATSRAMAEVALPVLAMTLTIVSVFLPVAFASGMVGKFLREFGITVSLAVLISLFEAFTLAPMLSAYFFKANASGKKSSGWFHRILGGGYARLLGWSLSHRAITLGVAAVFFAGTLAAMPFTGRAFEPDLSLKEFEMGLELPAGNSLARTEEAARQVEEALSRRPEVTRFFTTVGGSTGPEQATFFIKVNSDLQEKPLKDMLRQSFAPLGKVSFSDFSSSATGGGAAVGSVVGRPIQISVRGDVPLATLDGASAQIMTAIADVPGLVDLDRSLRSGKPELRVAVDRQRAADLGMNVAQIGGTVRTLVNGEVASQFHEGDDDIDIRVRLRPEDRQKTDQVLSLPVASPRGTTMPLYSVAKLSLASGPVQLEREDRQRQIAVGADFYGRPQGDVMADVQSRLAKLNLPPGVKAGFSGMSQQMTESFDELFFVLGLSVIFVYMVLASLFGSFFQPFIVMLALPLALVGAIFALLATGKPLDITAMIGVILLMGIVTKNSILLVDFANAQRREGTGLRDAIMGAGLLRLRPILMTTMALVLGMIPVALGLGEGGEMRSPMGTVVIGGLISSTLLTLVVVPVVYSLFEGLKLRLSRKKDAAA